jgi:LytS/YehU family sensor histidine kinase
MRSLQYVAIVIAICIVTTHFLTDLLLPVFIQQKRLLQFAALALLGCMVMAFVFTCVDAYYLPENRPFMYKWCNMMVSSTLIMGNICGLRFYREHANIEKKHRQLQIAHLEAELKLLRDQVNPHFLFNVINSIHVLMHKDVRQASSVLMKFSDMLRHHLYDSTKEYILLKEEIAYLQNYVNVEKVRWGNDVRVECNWIEAPEFFCIAPFILSPFVENAFKHVSRDHPDGNYVKIGISMQEAVLHFTVENTCDSLNSIASNNNAGGIGLENVKKRLSLLYNEKHQLETGRKENVFLVKLSLHVQAYE